MAQQPDQRGSMQKLFDRFLLSWRLMMDGRVELSSKILPLLAVMYVISPIDIIPEILLGPFGVVDDIGVALMALEFFIRMAPSDVVREHLETLRGRVSDTYAEKPKRYADEDVIEGDYEVK